MNQPLLQKFITVFINKLLKKDLDAVGVIVYVFYPYDTDEETGSIGHMYSVVESQHKYKCNHTLKQMVNSRAAEDY